jgi:hypothetical protein
LRADVPDRRVRRLHKGVAARFSLRNAPLGS